MTKYYKGKLLLLGNTILNPISFYTDDICSNKNFTNFYCDFSNIYINKSSLTQEENQILLEFICSNNIKNSTKTKILNKDVLDIIKKFINYSDKTKLNIIYEIVYDENNNAYAKEINTGLIFPIMNIEIDCYIFYDKHKYEDFFPSRKFVKINGYFEPELKKPNSFECYCIENGIANKDDIEKYKNNNSNSFDQKLKSLHNKNNLDNLNTTSNSIYLESLEQIRNILLLLSDKDISFIRDMDNELPNINILDYINMPKEEKENILIKRNKGENL